MQQSTQQIVSRGHTRLVNSSNLTVAAKKRHLKCLIIQHFSDLKHHRPLTEISFVPDGPLNSLLVSSAHGENMNSFDFVELASCELHDLTHFMS